MEIQNAYLLMGLEQNYVELYNPRTKEEFNMPINQEDYTYYSDLLESANRKSLKIDDFDELALPIVFIKVK